MPRPPQILRILEQDPRSPEPADQEAATAIRRGLGPQQVFPQESTVLDLFEERVAAAPDRPAVRYRDTTLTYAELDRAAGATASLLIARGVPQQSLIPVLVTDGPEFPTALFAVLKAGGAFVPLDPAWPTERLKTIAAELDPPVLLATTASSSTVAVMGLSDRTVMMDRNDPEHRATATIEGDRRPRPSDLIYGFYTSGSTGTPKCALNRHRGLVNRLTAMSRRFGDGAGHVALQNSRSTFDSSMWQVLWPLTSGGLVVLPERDGILDLEQTAATIGRYGITITDFVPSVLAAFVSLLELRPDLLDVTSCLRRMLIGGEAANPSVVHRLRKLLPDLQVTNTFGPTECSIGSVFHDIGDEDIEQIPIGKAIDNTAAIILDEDRRPVHAGTVGEIYLGGECLGAGYLHDPERTANAFVPNPFSEISGDLLYRTGDLARSDHNGQLYFVGRRDEQVKIGGVRLELGEVAGALAAHPLVGDAMAVVLNDMAEPSLVCCVTPRFTDNPPSVSQLRQFASERLPAELVPHRIIVLESLPVNQNGKADRKALTALLSMQAPADTEAAANPIEELISAAWREVLGVDQISVTVPFGEYGGTSLTAYRLTVAVSSRLGRTVRPRDLLTNPTVRAQAAVLAGDVADDGADLAGIVRDLAWLPPKVVLLTGGTGFIGAHVLADLLRHSDAKITCLVRASDPRDGARRLTASLQRYGLTSACSLLSMAIEGDRVEVVAGDLGQDYLGLSGARFAKIGAATTDVVHAGGMVNFLAGYLDHQPANVLGVQELIKLAGANCSRLHVLSTLSIFPLAGDGSMPIIHERQLPAEDRVATDGYSRSRYVAERLLEHARTDGVHSVIYRLGEVWPHRGLGVANPTSVAHNVLYACAQTGSVFDTDAVIDVTPVDVVSRFVVRCTIGEVQIPDGTLHVLWPTTLRFADAFGVLADRGHLDRVSYAEFRRRLEVVADAPDPDERLVRLRMMLPPAGLEARAPREFDKMFAASGRYFSAEGFVRHSASMSKAPTNPVDTLETYLAGLAAMPRHATTAAGSGAREAGNLEMTSTDNGNHRK